MKTTLKKVICCICVLIIMMSAFPNLLTSNTVQAASTYYSEYGIYFDVSTGTITDADETLTSLTIPDEINGVAVTKIGAQAFRNCSALKSITFPASLTSIAGDNNYGVFSGCSSLETVIFNNSAASIGSRVFSGCSKIKSISFGNSITSIGSNAFSNCYGLTTVSIPSTVTSIGSNAFYYCSNLTNAYIGSGATSIGTDAFAYCSKLTSIDVSESNSAYKSIDGVLFNKAGTTLIKYPPALSNTSYTILEGVTTISSKAFYGAKNLTNISFPSSLVTIGSSAFYECTALDNVELDSVESISGYAFYGCTSLSSINLGTELKTIDTAAFKNCSALKNITFPATLTSITGPSSSYDSDDGAFYRCSNLETIIFNNSPANIGNYTFYYCSNIKSVSFGNSITKIGSSAFSGCSGLTTVTLPSTVTSIGSNAFSSCSNLHIIYGYAGTVAEIYANNNGIKFIALGEYPGYPENPENPENNISRTDIYDPYYVTVPTRKNIFGVTKIPSIPENKTSEYVSELYEWATEFGYDDIITEEAAKEIVEKYMPTTYRVGDEYVRDNQYDTKSVMRDIIMLNSTKKSIYDWKDEFFVPNYSTKATDSYKRAMKILEGYADYCDSVDRNPVTNALYTVASTNYTKGKEYVKGKIETAGYALADYLLHVETTEGGAFKIPDKFWNKATAKLYNSYSDSTLVLEGDTWSELAAFSAIDFTTSVTKSAMEDMLTEALSVNDSASQMYTMYSKLKSIGGFVGDGFSSAIAPYKLAYELLEYTVDAGQNVNKAFVFLTQYHFINRYPELCGIMFNENGKICRDVITLNMEVLPKIDDDDYMGKILVNRLLEFGGIKDSIIFSIDDETNFAMMQSAVTMNLIDGLNVNALRKDLVEYWASVYSGEPVTKTNVYIPTGSSCTVSESVSLMSLSDNEYVATLDKNGVFETASENVSVIGRTDDAIIIKVIGDYNIQLSNATDNVLISKTTENAGDITNNIVSLYEANVMMNIATAGEEIFVTATDGTGEEKIAEPIATLDDTANKLLADADALTITFDAGDSADSVKNDLVLPDIGGYGSEISWKSSNTNVITDDGKVTRNTTDQTVTMTATLTLNNQNISKSFDVVVKANTVYITVDDCVVENNSIDVNAYAVNELSTDKDGVVIIALYNQNQLLETHIQEVSTTSQTNSNVKYEFLNCNFEETDTPVVKVLWWTDLEKPVPICNSVSQEIQ